MSWKICLLALAAITAAHGTFAQPIYKTIGPDGKPVYSDKPPTNPATKYSVIGAPPAQAAHPPQTTQPPQATQPGPAPTSGQGDPELEKALVEVMATHELVQQTEEHCVKARPAAAEKYNKAAESWKKRNARVLTHQRRVLLEAFRPAERDAIQAKVKARTREAMAGSTEHGPYAKGTWCEESLAQINSGSMDVASRPAVSSPLVNYKPKAP